MRTGVPFSVCFLLLMAALSGCGAGDGLRAGERNPVSGVYLVSAMMDTGFMRTTCPPPAHGYCYPAVATNGFAPLIGQLSVAESPESVGDRRVLRLSAMLHFGGCRTDATLTECVAPEPTTATAYYGTLSEDTLALVPLPLKLWATVGLTSIVLESTLAGDTLSGLAYWSAAGGSRYRGRFVARRQPAP